MVDAFLLPLAHAAHYLWVLYIPPVLIVLASIVRVAISERRDRGGDDDSQPGGGLDGEG